MMETGLLVKNCPGWRHGIRIWRKMRIDQPEAPSLRLILPGIGDPANIFAACQGESTAHGMIPDWVRIGR